ncbi:MAG TPA: hypothetical protein VMW50_12760 [Dehalococcoidia bacterium]|nr:hypothetical protein [Dehalococcoidia bacterium]
MANGIPTLGNIYSEMMGRYAEGGSALKSALGDIEAGKRRAVSEGTQNLISGGLFGTTITPTVSVAAEETAGRQRLAARGSQEQMLSNLQLALAQLAESARETQTQREFQSAEGEKERAAAYERALIGPRTQVGLTREAQQYQAQQEMAARNAANYASGSNYMANLFPDVYGRQGSVFSGSRGTTGGGSGTYGGGGMVSASNFPNLFGGQESSWIGPTPQEQISAAEARGAVYDASGNLVRSGDGGIEQQTKTQVTANLPESAQESGGFEAQGITTKQETDKFGKPILVYYKNGVRVGSRSM